MTQLVSKISLYISDFALWLSDTVARLKVRDVDNLDWDNLAEEIESFSEVLEEYPDTRFPEKWELSRDLDELLMTIFWNQEV